MTPLQMARFYALVANRGKLVTPHVVAAVEAARPGNGPALQPLVRRAFHPPAKELNLDPTALQVVRDGLFEATHSPLGTSSSVFGQYPIGIAGKTGTAEKVVDGVPDRHLLVVRLRPCRGPDARRLRGDRERRLRRRGGRAVGSPGLRVLLRQAGDGRRPGEHRLMVDYAAGQRVSARPRRPHARRLVPAQSRLGAAVRGRSARRLRALGDRRDHARRRPGRPELLRDAPGVLRGDRGRRHGRDDTPRAQLLAAQLRRRCTSS